MGVVEIVSMGDTQVKERRGSKRITFSLPVHLELDGETNSCEYETANISKGGVFIPTDSPLPVSTKVTLVIPFSALETKTQAAGTVVRSNSQPIEGGGNPRVWPLNLQNADSLAGVFFVGSWRRRQPPVTPDGGWLSERASGHGQAG